jgi:formate dehydrogenase major subunit/formate dehydrogenase alpha subunit
MGSESVIVIDGQEFSFSPGETILQVAQRNGFDIPTLCYLKGASPTGACRICVVRGLTHRCLQDLCGRSGGLPKPCSIVCNACGIWNGGQD